MANKPNAFSLRILYSTATFQKFGTLMTMINEKTTFCVATVRHSAALSLASLLIFIISISAEGDEARTARVNFIRGNLVLAH